MKNYYITTVETFHKYANSMHPQHGAHYIDLENGKILLAFTWPEHEHDLEKFEAEPDVEVLHKPLLHGTLPIYPQHIETLKSHPTLGAEHGDTILHLSKKAAKIMPLMKLTGL